MLKTKSTHFDVRRIKLPRAIKQHSPIPNIAAFNVYVPIAVNIRRKFIGSQLLKGNRAVPRDKHANRI